jgi:dTDP-4-amino-4,6-dideoxygalactose transaminase
MIPFIDLAPVTRLVAADAEAAWRGVLERCELVGGAGVQALERALAAYLGSGEAIACASGSDALRLALQAAGVGPGMHVALPDLTFWATYEAVVQLGAIPVLVDISPDDLQLDLDALRAAHDRHRFRHAIVVHLYGWASGQLAALRAFCRAREIALVEDAAQAAGVTLDGQPVLADAAIASLSFYPAKVLGGCMDGGAVVTRDPALAARVRSLANHGRTGHYAYGEVGWNSRMGGLQARYLLEVVRRADHIVAERRALAARYRERLAGLAHHGPPAGVGENGYLTVVTCDDPDGAAKALAARGVATARTYPSTLDEQPPARGQAVLAGDLRHARALVRRVLNLPLYYGLAPADLDRAAAAALDVLG